MSLCWLGTKRAASCPPRIPVTANLVWGWTIPQVFVRGQQDWVEHKTAAIIYEPERHRMPVLIAHPLPNSLCGRRSFSTTRPIRTLSIVCLLLHCSEYSPELKNLTFCVQTLRFFRDPQPPVFIYFLSHPRTKLSILRILPTTTRGATIWRQRVHQSSPHFEFLGTRARVCVTYALYRDSGSKLMLEPSH